MTLPASRAYISTITNISHTSRRLYHPISKSIKYQTVVTAEKAAFSNYIKTQQILPQIQAQVQQRHPFSSSACLSKKKDKNRRNDDGDSPSSASRAESEAPDPFDYTQLHNGIADAMTRLKEDLQKLRSGGRFNPEVIEQLRVNIVKGSNKTVKLGEVAQVVPKGGRSVVIIVGEEEVSFFIILKTNATPYHISLF